MNAHHWTRGPANFDGRCDRLSNIPGGSRAKLIELGTAAKSNRMATSLSAAWTSMGILMCGSRNLGLSTFRIGVVYDVLHKYASHMAYQYLNTRFRRPYLVHKHGNLCGLRLPSLHIANNLCTSFFMMCLAVFCILGGHPCIHRSSWHFIFSWIRLNVHLHSPAISSSSSCSSSFFFFFFSSSASSSSFRCWVKSHPDCLCLLFIC